MLAIKKLFINNKKIILEAELFKTEADEQKIALLLTHPHPGYGGNMYNNVVTAVFDKFINKGITSLRFNFRGVGSSTGSFTDGSGELSDVQACIDFLLLKLKCDTIFICGYSYGAAIGCSAVNYSEKIIGYAAVSFPWDFMGEKYKILSQTNKPKLFIQGDRDELAVYSKFEPHFKSYSDPKASKIINGADHFYWGFENLVADEVYNYLIKIVN
ncbi:MAG: alpha/beta hydrolase [Candidatus Hermodarchaeota archaeon]